jgi:hypothetical protein
MKKAIMLAIMGSLVVPTIAMAWPKVPKPNLHTGVNVQKPNPKTQPTTHCNNWTCR